MKAAILIKDMVNVTRSNRLLLRGDDSAKFRNFDREAYLGKQTHFRAPQYLQASPEYLKLLHQKLVIENHRIRKQHGMGLIFALGVVVAILTIILNSSF